MSGPYSELAGPGSVAAARLAVQDFDAAAKGIKVEIISGDMQNKADVGVNIATSWFDVEKVDVIVDLPNSAIALAVSDIARQKNKLFLAVGTATSNLTGAKCNANTIHWLYDTWANANGTGKAMVKSGGDTWFFVTVDYAFGHAAERDAVAAIEANGGKVVGKVRHPLNTPDFSSFLLQAQASKAKVVGLANGGAHHQRGQAGGRVWDRQGRTKPRRHVHGRERCCCARFADRPRSRLHGRVVLGRE
jgi:branched-chain amino acid transport system substrate-binding protein